MDMRRAVGLVGIACLCAFFASPRWRALGYLPVRVAVDAGDSVRLSAPLPWAFGARLEGVSHGPVELDGEPLASRWQRLRPQTAVTVRPTRAGRYAVAVGAFGLPLRHLEIDSVRPPMLVPSGQSIGIRVRTAGLLVVSRSLPRPGRPWRLPFAPASELRPGDRIVSANGNAVSDKASLTRVVATAGRAGRRVRLGLVRGGRVTFAELAPRPIGRDGRYRLGVLVREGLSGIGTLTFVDPGTGVYAALGHRIQDGWTGQSVPVAAGRVAAAPIIGIRRGFIGRPGEKIGHLADGAAWGDVEGSGPYGIFGRLHPAVATGRPMAVATADQVHVGQAWLWTVVSGQRVERFRVRIERVDARASGGRGLVVRVVDADLLRRAGGIVQGMSGSPIIQDGRLAGALTHVLVSDNTRGYGIFAAWMWQEAKVCAVANENKARLSRRSSTVRAG